MDELTGRSAIRKRESDGEGFGGGGKRRNTGTERGQRLMKRMALGFGSLEQGPWESRRHHLKMTMKDMKRSG